MHTHFHAKMRALRRQIEMINRMPKEASQVFTLLKRLTIAISEMSSLFIEVSRQDSRKTQIKRQQL